MNYYEPQDDDICFACGHYRQDHRMERDGGCRNCQCIDFDETEARGPERDGDSERDTYDDSGDRGHDENCPDGIPRNDG